MVKTSDCGSDIHGFESHYPPHKKPNNFCYRAFYFVEILDLRTHTRRELYSCRIANRLNEQ